jgi:SAM-dependent methyltransferase
MPESPSSRPRAPIEVYNPPGMEWSLRVVGHHLHPRGEDATVALAERAAAYGFPTGGTVLEVASALGGPARYLARRFGATVLGVDMDPRMHAAARTGAVSEGLQLIVQQVLGVTERLPFRDSAVDAAWSQDAMCHMDKAAVVSEVARVLKPGGIFAFTDWVALTMLGPDEEETLSRLWSFPKLLRIGEYTGLLGRAGLELLLAEDRTPWVQAARPAVAADQEIWLAQFTARWGAEVVEQVRASGEAWRGMVRAGRTGHGMFIARRSA